MGCWSLTDFEGYSSGRAGRFGDVHASDIVGIGGDAEDFRGQSDRAAVDVCGFLGFAGGFGEGRAGLRLSDVCRGCRMGMETYVV